MNNKKITWINGHTTLTLKNSKQWNQLTKEQYKIAAQTRSNFRNWVIKQGIGKSCSGQRGGSMAGIAVNYHDGTCCDEQLITPPVTFDAVKEFALSEHCTLEELEIQAEHALRLYQRVKSFEVPYSKDNNKETTARYRARRQAWLDLIHAKTQA